MIMKILFPFIAAFFMISCSNAQKDRFSDAALNEKLQSLDGTNVSFSEILNKHKGKPVVIEVWASWCSDCIKAMPKLKDTQAAFPDVDYVFISMDKTSDKWKEGIEKYSLRGDHYLAPDGMKGAFGSAISLNWIPRYIVVDKDGNPALYNAIETDFDKIHETLKSIK